MSEESDFEAPELISLEYANLADLSCGGCRVSAIDDDLFVE